MEYTQAMAADSVAVNAPATTPTTTIRMVMIPQIPSMKAWIACLREKDSPFG